MNMKEWLNNIISVRVKKPMPVLSFPATSITGDSVGDIVTSSEKQALCMVAAAKRFDMPFAPGFMDLSVEAEAFGCKTTINRDELPSVTGTVVDIDRPETAEISLPAIGTGRTGIYIDAISMVKEKITDRPVFAGTIGPFSLVSRLMGMNDAMIACADEPDMLETLLERVMIFLNDYILAFRAAGADGVIMAEPAAGLLSPSMNSDFSVPYVEKIIKSVKNDSFTFMYHNCGPYTSQQIGDLLSAGADIYHFSNAVDLSNIAGFVPENVAFAGNVAPVETFLQGTPEKIRSDTLDVLEKCGGYKNFIPSSGCDIPAKTPLENIDVFFETVREYYESELK